MCVGSTDRAMIVARHWTQSSKLGIQTVHDRPQVRNRGRYDGVVEFGLGPYDKETFEKRGIRCPSFFVEGGKPETYS